ncbi:MAG: hypothetical protein AAF715_18725 [Myxococcota bacterium]
MRWTVVGGGLGLIVTGCSFGVDLPAEFAARAEEVPMTVPGGTFPPGQFAAGPYDVYDVARDASRELRIALGPISAQIGGTWTLRARVRGATEAEVVCVGPPEFWRRDRTVDVQVGQASLGCEIKVDGVPWSFLYGVDLDDRMGDLPAWARELGAGRVRDRSDRRDLDALVVGPEEKTFTVAWAHQTVRVGNQGGYFAYVDGVQVAAIDVSALGAPKLYVARDTPESLEPTVVTAMLTAYLVAGSVPR